MDSPENVRIVQRQAMNRSTFYLLLFVLSLLFINFSEDEAARQGRPTIEDVLDSLRHEKEALGNVTFGVNVTHPLPTSLESQLSELGAIATQGPNSRFYHNITGVFRGHFTNHNVTVPHDDKASNITAQQEARGSFFESTVEGSFTFNVKSTKTKDDAVNYIEGYLRLKDDAKGGYGALLLAEGVHFLSNGTIYVMGVPDGTAFRSIDLLHMLPSNESMIQARSVLFEQIEQRIDELDEMAAWGSQTVDDHDRPMSVAFDCVFQIFGQLHPLPSDIKLWQLLEYEKELENPQGVSTISPPSPEISMMMYSHNCGLSLAVKDGEGTKIEKYYSKAISYAAMAIVLALIQISVLIHQMEFTPTPSSVSNVSYWTIAMQAMMDSYLCLLHLTTGVVIETVFLPFAAAAFFNFLLVAVFGMRYLLVIWRIQRPESLRSSSEENNNETRSQQEPILPLANSQQPARPSPTAPDPRRDISSIYYRLYALLLFGLFLFYQTEIRSAFVQNLITFVLGLGFHSFWIPQIMRNVLRGCRRPLSRRYVLGMSITRLAIPLYFYACPYNVIGREPSPWVWLLVAYVALQVIILFLQDALGPRFFVPEKYLPQTYNYHPILPADDEETGHGQSDNGPSRLHPRDCAICMLPVDTTPAGPAGLNVLGRAQYMLTPCQHLFHTECLERWMRIKLECPVCRSYLPAC